MSERLPIISYNTTGTSQPAAVNLESGEIAVGRNADNPRLWIKDTNSSIVEFIPAVPVVNMTDTTATIQPNKFYVWGTVTQLNISLGTISNTGVYNEYMFQFTSGSSATTLSLPSNITWYLGINTVSSNKTYQVSIVNNLAILAEF